MFSRDDRDQVRGLEAELQTWACRRLLMAKGRLM